MERLLTKAEAAEYLQLTPSGVDYCARRGLRKVKLSDGKSGAVRFRQSDLEAYVNSKVRGPERAA